MREQLKKLVPAGLSYINDMRDVDGQEVVGKIVDNTKLSLSFVVLLTMSSIISTLGLLLNTPAIVIGGMIISPLVWPLMKIAIGVSFARRALIRQATFLLLLSVVITTAAAYLVSAVSPIKHLNSEIVSRTTPTILDIFVALSAGVIAAMALTQKKVSDSLAGVAIATSLMPPLCVAGIGLSLGSLATFYGGSLLFAANAVSIIFAAVLVFILVGAGRNSGRTLQVRGILTILAVLLVTAIPLVLAMKNYSFKVNAYDRTVSILNREFGAISPMIYVQNVVINLENERKTGAVGIEAELLIPEDVTVNYQQKAEIIGELEKALGKNIELNLRMQKTINLVSEQDLVLGKIKTRLSESVKTEIAKINSGIGIDAIEIDYNSQDKVWKMEVVVRSDPSIAFSELARGEIEQVMQDQVDAQVQLNIDVISRLKLVSQPELESDQIKQDVQKMIEAVSPQIDLVSFRLVPEAVAVEGTGETTGLERVLITLDLQVPQGVSLKNSEIEGLKQALRDKYKKEFFLVVNVVEKKVL